MQTQKSQCRFDWLDRSTCLARANGANDETPNPTTRAPTTHPTTKSPTQNPTTKNPTTKPTQSINVLTDFPTFSPTEGEVITPRPTPKGTPKPTMDCTALWHVHRTNNDGCTNNDDYPAIWMTQMKDQMFHDTFEECCAAFFKDDEVECQEYNICDSDGGDDDGDGSEPNDDEGTTPVSSPDGDCKGTMGWHVVSD